MAEQANTMAGDDGEDLYASGDDKQDEMPAKEDEGGEEEQSDSEEAILPKTILAGKQFNVGDEVVLKITAIHDNGVSVKYAPAKPEAESEGGETSDKAEMPSAMAGGGGDSMYD